MQHNNTNAKVAQLVEHDLAKVGVASSNLVFRSKAFPKEGFYFKRYFLPDGRNAQMVELVDTQDLKSCDLKSRAGSIPALSTGRERVEKSTSFPFLFSRNFLLI